MASVFVSHSSRDRALTERVVARLRAAGFAALFVDFDPEQGIPAGRSWERELYAQLRRTDAVVFLASPASVGSRWCFAELSLARSLGRPVFPVRLQPGVGLPLLADVHWTDLTDPDAADADAGAGGLARLLAGLRSAGLDPADSFAWDPHRSPYPGLAPFAPEDAAVFFGRRPETHRLVELLTPTLQRGPGRLVAVVGPSGSGKSSLLHAGLLPRLARMPQRWLVVPPLRPGRQPTATLAGCLARAFAGRGRPRPAEELGAVLAQGSVGLVQLAGELADLAANGRGRPGVLVVVDQAEELLTRTGPAEQEAFLGLLTGALGEDSPLWMVATLRSEFLRTAPDRAGLAEAIDDPLMIEPLSRARLAEVIARPAQRAGLEFPPGLVERMVEDTAGGDALPLLAYTLRELCRRAGPDGQITIADYEAVGGVLGALRHRADQLAEELGRRGHGELVVPTLLQLATVTGNDEPTRRRAQRSTLTVEEQFVVDAFVDAHLLTSSQTPADPGGDRASDEQLGGEATVEVAHEALLRQWPPLRKAIEADRAGLRLRSELERLAADWQQSNRDESYLLRSGRLAVFADWTRRVSDELGPVEREFLEASRAMAVRELEAARRSNRRLRALAAGLLALLVAVLASGGLAWQRDQKAQAQTRLALSRQIAAQADRLVDSRPEVAILLGLQSMSLARDQHPVPPAGLVTGLARISHPSQVLAGHTDPIWGVAFSPDGRLLATTSADRTVRLWDLASGQPHGAPLTGHTGSVLAVAFSPDGRLLATTSADRTVRLWDVVTREPQGQPMRGHTGAVPGMAFSPDGRLLATTGVDRTLRLWDVATGRAHARKLTDHTDTVWGVAFSPDGRQLATVGDHRVRLWDVATGQPGGEPLIAHTDEVTGVAFSPDGQVLATTGRDQTVRLWEVETGQPRGAPLTGHTGPVWRVAFSPDGRLLATASHDRTVRLWEVTTGRPRGEPLTGHSNEVQGVAFSPNGQLLASAGADQTVRLWDVAETYSISQPLTGHTDAVYGVAFSPDNQLLATASADRTVRLWDVATRQQRGEPLTGHTDGVQAVAFSPDGRLLATAGGDVRLWEVVTGQPRGAPLTGHTDAVLGVAFSPDGRLLATTSGDETVWLWDVATGQPHGAPLTGHTNAVYGVAFSPDGRLLATASGDRTLRLWDVATGQPHGVPLTGHTNGVYGVVFSPDGRLLASNSVDFRVQLWDVATGQRWGEPLTSRSIIGVAFSPDGTLLASGGGDVQLWDVATGQPHGPPLDAHTEAVMGVAFSPDGLLLASASADRTVRLWHNGFSSWLASGCGLVKRNLSIEEWNELLPGVPYERTCPNLAGGEGAPPDSPAARY